MTTCHICNEPLREDAIEVGQLFLTAEALEALRNVTGDQATCLRCTTGIVRANAAGRG